MYWQFTRQKNHVLAIKTFKKISKKYTDVDLVIIGEGELKKEYENLINKLNLNGRISILDYDQNVFKCLKKSAVLISPSLWEDLVFYGRSGCIKYIYYFK